MKPVFTKEELSEIFQQNIKYDIYDICINSKIAQHGDIFIALPGENTDGHNFVAEAIKKGASLAIVEKNIDSIPHNKLIMCSSTYNALLRLAQYNINRSKTQYICVTGSVGKTTTKNMIYHILNKEASQKIYTSRKNFNSKIGLPICAATMPPDSDIGIFEMGMNHSGDIKHLIDIINPHTALITNIYPVHAEFFASEWDIAKSKAEIFEKSPEYAVIPGNSPYTNFFKTQAKIFNVKNIITFGENRSDANIISCSFHENTIDIHAQIFGKSMHYRINSINDTFVINSLAAITAAHVTTGIDIQLLADNIESFTTTSNRGGIEYLNNRITLIDDSYNASPASVKAALRALSRFKNNRKIAILGDMKELGSNEISFHENLSATIDKYGIDAVFTCGELSKYTYNNLQKHKQKCWCKTSIDLIEPVIKYLEKGDCILIKGSRSMKMENIVNAIRDTFNK